MARGGRIPKQWMTVLPARSFLQQKPAAPIQNANVDRPVTQVIPMHFIPRRVPRPTVVSLDIRLGKKNAGRDGAKKLDPVLQLNVQTQCAIITGAGERGTSSRHFLL